MRTATSTASEAEEGKDVKAPPKKVYYLFCSLCRWSSRDAGIPDQTVGKDRFYCCIILLLSN